MEGDTMGQSFQDGNGSQFSPSGSFAVWGDSNAGYGVYGSSQTSNAMEGQSHDGAGVFGTSFESFGVGGYSGNVGVWAHNFSVAGGHDAYLGARCCAGDFYGDVWVHGDLHVIGDKHFVIDHPLDPANKYLYHSSVESPDRKTVYDGTTSLDDKGEATIELPGWFEVLNRDFRYQLTCLGGYAPVYIAEKLQGNRFKIAGGEPGLEVSWQVTGIRQDAWAQAHPIVVEMPKPKDEQGYFLNPAAHGESNEKHLRRARYARLVENAEVGRPGSKPDSRG
jgi:hypothetical protein